MPQTPPLDEDLRQIGRHRWSTLRRTAKDRDTSLPEDAAAVAHWQRALALSDFVFRTCQRMPHIPIALLAGPPLSAARTLADYRQLADDALSEAGDADAAACALRRLRQREMVRIVLRDLNHLGAIEQIMSELSAFADAVLQSAAGVIYRQLSDTWGVPRKADGTPQQLIIVGMGKLGAEELNFSSDIDLVFVFPGSGHTTGGGRSTSAEDFFTRMCRQLLQLIGAKTADGIVFRVDARLRPFGENGPLVMSIDAMEDYYQIQGREWERYAWIKARQITGIPDDGRELFQRLRPFVYRRYLDYGVIDSLRDMKAMIAAEVRKKAMAANIKLGPGGIREIEFFGQIFQLMRGGVIPALQDRRITVILERLSSEGIAPAAVCRELQDAYRFLRTVEQKIQALADRQTHDLPEDETARKQIAAAMGFDDWAAFLSVLDRHRRGVHSHFDQLLASTDAADPSPEDAVHRDALAAAWHGDAADPHAAAALETLGFGDGEQTARQLAEFKAHAATRAMSPEGRDRLDRLMPRVISAAGRHEQPDVVLQRILALLRAVEQRTNYLSLLIENPSVLDHLVRLAGVSPWIMAFLARHPVLLDELLDPRTLYRPPDKSELAAEIEKRLNRLDSDDLEYQIETLCIFKQINTLRVAAADITGALPLMRTSDHLTWIAEVAVERVMDLSWHHLVAKHGRPRCDGGDCGVGTGFAVIAYGKMGGIELGYGSDLDLVFLHSAVAGLTDNPARPLDTPQFYARLGQRMIHILTAHTRAGRLYETDMRLRPSGNSGILVSHVDGFHEYQRKEAWTWEHQALVRARPICGDPELIARFNRIRAAILAIERNPEQLRTDVLDMRQRMRDELLKPEPRMFDLKQGNGGIVDIEFMVQYLVLRHAHRHPEALTQWSDNVRQLEALLDCGIVTDRQAHFLKNAYLTYRAAAHRYNLQETPAMVPEERFRDLARQVSDMWKTVMMSGAF